MTVKRIENLNIKKRKFFTAIVGNTDDVFIDNDLCEYNFEEQLSLYLRSKGYDYIYFYSRSREYGLYSYDGQEALQWLFLDNEQQEGQNQDAVDDGRPLGRTGRFRKRRSTDNSNNGHIRRVDNYIRHTYWCCVNFRDTTLTGQVKKILENRRHKSVICFLTTEFEPAERQGLSDGLNQISSVAASARNPNKVLIVYEAKDTDELYSKHFEHPDRVFFHSDLFVNQFTKGNTLNMKNIFMVDVPDEVECKNWINFQRIINNSLDSKKVFSFPIDKLAEQIRKKKKTLREWNIEIEDKDRVDSEFIDNLRVKEFSESYLRDALSKIHGQQDNMDVITKKVVTFVNKIEFSKVEKPLVLMFAGTSGTGKTYTAETIANALKSHEFGYLLLDMNTYSNEMGTARLLGSAPGYVGSGQDSPIFAERKRHDRLVIVFDEIEKADPVLFKNLMTLLDKGSLSNGRGEAIDFRESIIIFTTNLCMERLTTKKAELKRANVDIASYRFQQDTKQILKNGGIPNEISGRIGCLLIYNPLTKETVVRIAIEEIRKLGNKYNLRVNNIPESLLKETVEIANSNEGARPIREFVENKLDSIFLQESIRLSNLINE